MGATKEKRRCAKCKKTVGYISGNKFIPNADCALPKSLTTGKYLCKNCDKKETE